VRARACMRVCGGVGGGGVEGARARARVCTYNDGSRLASYKIEQTCAICQHQNDTVVKDVMPYSELHRYWHEIEDCKTKTVKLRFLHPYQLG